MSRPIRYCEDCVFYEKGHPCSAPQNTRMSVASLIARSEPPVYRWYSYSAQREHGWFWSRFFNQCGRSGRWWKVFMQSPESPRA